jgi:hypothetical protein
MVILSPSLVFRIIRNRLEIRYHSHLRWVFFFQFGIFPSNVYIALFGKYNIMPFGEECHATL